MDVEIISLDEFNLPIAASAELSKYALFLRYCSEKIYNAYNKKGVPPRILLPWLKEYRHALNDVHAMTAAAITNDTKSQSIKVFIDIYNTMQDELPENARRELAAVAQKKRLDAKDAELTE